MQRYLDLIYYFNFFKKDGLKINSQCIEKYTALKQKMNKLLKEYTALEEKEPKRSEPPFTSKIHLGEIKK